MHKKTCVRLCNPLTIDQIIDLPSQLRLYKRKVICGSMTHCDVTYCSGLYTFAVSVFIIFYADISLNLLVSLFIGIYLTILQVAVTSSVSRLIHFNRIAPLRHPLPQ